MHICKHCGREKPETDFYFGSRTKCKECKKKQSAKQPKRKCQKKKRLSRKDCPFFVCEYCGNSIENKTGVKRRFCSRNCANLAARTREVVNCVICGKGVERRKGAENPVCSAKCKAEYYRRLDRSKWKKPSKRPKRLRKTGLKRIQLNFKERLREIVGDWYFKSKQMKASLNRDAILLDRWEVKAATWATTLRIRNGPKLKTVGKERKEKKKGIAGMLHRLKSRQLHFVMDKWQKWALNLSSNNRKRIRRKQNAKHKSQRVTRTDKAAKVQMRINWDCDRTGRRGS